ncbi:MAG: hypothetical protein ABW110_09280 [Steroidobacteraceae bacterium]
MSLSDALINPDDNLPEQDLPFTPPRGIKGWTEHYAFFAYDADAAHGVFIHIGRVPDDPTIWRGTIQIFLPGADMLVAKYFGRDGDQHSAGAGPLRVRCEQPFRRFVAEFDGMVQRTTRQAITAEVVKDTVSEWVKLRVVFDAAAPIHGKQAEKKNRADGSFHTEQIGRITGEMTVAGNKIALSGTGVRDHSSGVREYGKVISHQWIHGLFPSGLAFSVLMYRTTTNPEARAVNIFRGDGSPLEYVELVEHSDYPDLDTAPGVFKADPLEDPHFRSGRLVLRTSKGPLSIQWQLVHTHAITYVDPCEELNGTDRSRPNAVQMCDAPAIFTCNGERGAGLFERSARIAVLG